MQFVVVYQHLSKITKAIHLKTNFFTEVHAFSRSIEYGLWKSGPSKRDREREKEIEVSFTEISFYLKGCVMMMVMIIMVIMKNTVIINHYKLALCSWTCNYNDGCVEKINSFQRQVFF